MFELKPWALSLFSGAELFFGRHVTGLYRRGASWEVQKKAGGSETFDAVILTMPVPQILQLEGDVTQCELLTNYTNFPSHHAAPYKHYFIGTCYLNDIITSYIYQHLFL